MTAHCCSPNGDLCTLCSPVNGRFVSHIEKETSESGMCYKQVLIMHTFQKTIFYENTSFFEIFHKFKAFKESILRLVYVQIEKCIKMIEQKINQKTNIHTAKENIAAILLYFREKKEENKRIKKRVYMKIVQHATILSF